MKSWIRFAQTIATDFSYYQDKIIIIIKNDDKDKVGKEEEFYHNTVVIPKMVGDELVWMGVMVRWKQFT